MDKPGTHIVRDLKSWLVEHLKYPARCPYQIIFGRLRLLNMVKVGTTITYIFSYGSRTFRLNLTLTLTEDGTSTTTEELNVYHLFGNMDQFPKSRRSGL